MKKKRNAFLVIVGVIALLLSSLVVSCLTPDTAYRVGYDIGSSLSYDGETLNPDNK